MKQSRYKIIPLMAIALLITVTVSPAIAQAGIAILDFELNDLTGVVPIPDEEIERTASIAPSLRKQLQQKGHEIISISNEEQRQANAGFGYLYDHPDEAAQLGNQHKADIVVTGRLHKPSFLFAYLKVRLTDARSARSLGEFIVEVKGGAKMVTERGVIHLARQIDETLKRYLTPTPEFPP